MATPLTSTYFLLRMSRVFFILFPSLGYLLRFGVFLMESAVGVCCPDHGSGQQTPTRVDPADFVL